MRPIKAALGLGVDGEPSMTFYDKKIPGPETKESGNPPNDLKQIFDEMEKASARRTRAVFGVSANGEPSLTLADEEGHQRAVLGSTLLEAQRTGTMTKRPASSLVLFDKQGKVIWQAPER